MKSVTTTSNTSSIAALENKQRWTDEDQIDDYLPTKGWLADYVDFGATLEVCSRFRFFTACSILGASINNRIWIQRGDPGLLPKLFPNVWVLLLAPPGRGHKTSTINMGINCLSQACPEVRLLADKLTPESLVKALSEPEVKERIRIGPRDATGLIKAPELSVFFGKQQYNVGLVSLITDLYDFREEWSSDTIMRGKNVLRNICISIIGGSTPDWLQSMLPQDAFTGGFMSRYIIVEMPPDYFKRVPSPRRGDALERWSYLITELRKFSAMKGEMSWTPDGEREYEDHYSNLIPTGEPQVDAYQEREAEQIIKVAMLLAISVGEMEVQHLHMKQARSLLSCLMKETAPRIERLTTHPRMKLVQELQDLLKMYPNLTRKALLQKVYRGLSHGEPQFLEAMRILILTGKIEQSGDTRNPVYTLTGKGGDTIGDKLETDGKSSPKGKIHIS